MVQAGNATEGLLGLAWSYLELLNLPLPLPGAVVDIFNDGPDPVESSEEQPKESSQEDSDDDSSNSMVQPFDSGGCGVVSGPQE
jgi:hypothetical protein